MQVTYVFEKKERSCTSPIAQIFYASKFPATAQMFSVAVPSALKTRWAYNWMLEEEGEKSKSARNSATKN